MSNKANEGSGGGGGGLGSNIELEAFSWWYNVEFCVLEKGYDTPIVVKGIKDKVYKHRVYFLKCDDGKTRKPTYNILVG